MAQPPFPSRFAGPPPPPPPQFRCFPPAAVPFRGPPPSFPPFPGRGLPPPAYPPPPQPPPPVPPPHLPPWPQRPVGPEQPPPFSPWRPEAASALRDGERARPAALQQGPPGPAAPPPPRDEGGGDPWLSRWVARHGGAQAPGRRGAQAPPQAAFGPSQAARVAAEALRRVARLSALCGAWRARGDQACAQEVAEGEALLAELRETVRPLRSGEGPGSPLAQLRRRLERSRKKRLRRRQGRQEAREAREEAAARVAEKEAQIERWRARRAQEVEDRRREQELKAAADSVLSEVRKKQADTKRVAEILRGLEKLRKLRKEAAGRKGVCPPPGADEAFENEIQSLRTSIKKRTELYEAEERALRVMLEGEQEEERKRELEKKQKKEKEKLLQQKREMDSKLFGDPDEFPLTRILEPYTQYYLQAEYSASALIQIRHEWDRYLIPTDHPEGHFIPPGWVLPSPPLNDVWATAVR